MKKLLAICLWLLAIGLWVQNYYLLAPTFSIPESYRFLYEEVLAPVVKITCPNGVGSGVVISSLQASSSRLQNVVPSGSRVNELIPCSKRTGNATYVLSAAHVVGNQSKVQVHIYDYELGVVTIKSATVIITDTYKDLALLTFTSKNKLHPLVKGLRCAKLADRNYKPYLFTEVYAVGCSLGLDPRPSEGIITAKREWSPNPSGVRDGSYWEVSAPVLPGNSGGGVFLKDTHELIGIVVWVRTYHGQLVTTMCGIVPINQVYEFLSNNRITPRGSWGGSTVSHAGDSECAIGIRGPGWLTLLYGRG